MCKFILVFLLCFISLPAEAQMYQCKGFDDTGKSISVIVDFITNVLNIDGSIHKFASGGTGATYANTENFSLADNLIVYDSFTIINNHFYLIQLNVYTKKPVFSASLTCNK